MKILYAIQGTGNGHLTRSLDIVPILKKKAMVDVLVSGIQADVKVPFKIDYRYHGLSFLFGKKGGVDILNTIGKSKLPLLWKEINTVPVEQYDLIITDFEPVSAWAAHRKNIPCIELSHQAAVLHPMAPRPDNKDLLGKTILKHYSPAELKFGFHFESYIDGIYTPVIRDQVRNHAVKNEGHYTVYLPSYGDEHLIRILSHFKDLKWEVFSKHSTKDYREKNVQIIRIDNDLFVKSMASSQGVLCGAGFETPAETLFLGKKLMVIPMKSQYEQQCNAIAAARLGVPVIPTLNEASFPIIERWINSPHNIKVSYPNQTEAIIDQVLLKSINHFNLKN
jgi:uncharacterized protein (TIGR00661 family)